MIKPNIRARILMLIAWLFRFEARFERDVWGYKFYIGIFSKKLNRRKR